ncbi:DUF7453 family protein [Sorangium atrum]|uniref:Secreted protein n=1 Tax=Sorangium atrum TaxID=2995308 RepID=A0ABT5CB86_9BACT|nr:choice-of-anchor tandem repeat NxxGxxAF-containing protein [Sorangium aterium]MDC0683080.1 hypothetical protein [Sorangium aterium]
MRTNRFAVPALCSALVAAACGTGVDPEALAVAQQDALTYSSLAREAEEYVFTALAFLDTPTPGEGTFVNDFEVGGLNDFGDTAFGADVSTGGEGVFLRHRGRILELGRTGGDAPGGGTFSVPFFGPVDLNDRADMVFNYPLEPFTLPYGVNAGAYRYSHATRSVTAVVRPGVTPAPGGGKFQGVFFAPTINNRGQHVFAGLVKTAKGFHAEGQPYGGLGIGAYVARPDGDIDPVVVPGDAAPGGGRFDYIVEPWINDRGDVSFIGHIAGEPGPVPGFPEQSVLINALGSLYVKRASGRVRSIVHAGDPAPGGGAFRQVFHDVMNRWGDIAFNGDLTPFPGANEDIGVFVYLDGRVEAVARPGDPMPGGGTLINASLIGGNIHINDRREVVFSAHVHDDDLPLVTGLYRWSRGRLSVVARTGTVIPGIGTVDQLDSPQIVIPPPPHFSPAAAAVNNNLGQVAFQALLTDRRGVMLLASPYP